MLLKMKKRWSKCTNFNKKLKLMVVLGYKNPVLCPNPNRGTSKGRVCEVGTWGLTHRDTVSNYGDIREGIS